MRRKSDIPLRKYTLNLFEGEPERLQQLYRKQGYGAIIRNLVHHHLRKVEERAALKTQDLEIEV
jgi:hypothetical protein